MLFVITRCNKLIKISAIKVKLLVILTVYLVCDKTHGDVF